MILAAHRPAWKAAEEEVNQAFIEFQDLVNDPTFIILKKVLDVVMKMSESVEALVATAEDLQKVIHLAGSMELTLLPKAEISQRIEGALSNDASMMESFERTLPW